MKLTRRKILGSAIGLLGLMWSATSPVPAVAAEKFVMLDFIVLNDGADLSDRLAYEGNIKPIAKKYGMKPIHAYNLQHLDGKIKKASRLVLWQLQDPSAVVKLTNDKEYQSHVPGRNEIHNMQDLTLYMSNAVLDSGQITDKAVLVDLVVLNEGITKAERDAYEDSIAPITAKHGINKVANFEIQQKMNGAGPEKPLRLNLWTLDDPKGLQSLFADPEFAKVEKERNRVHDFSQLTLFIGQPAK